MPWYRDGTVSVTSGQTTVTGTNTNFALNARVGDAFQGPDGRWYEVANIASANVLGIMPAYQGATVSGGAYGITPINGYVKDIADRASQIINQWGTSLANLGDVATEDVVPVSKGGTGGTTQQTARDGLGLGAVAVENVLPVAKGGTGGTDQASARTGLGLGTAAIANVTTSSTDTTPGRVMKVGDFGLGGAVPVLGGATGIDLNGDHASGHYYLSLPLNGPPGVSYGYLEQRRQDSNFVTQTVRQFDGSGEWFRVKVSGTWNGWTAVGVIPALGWGQTWQVVTSSRAFNTTYINNTGKPIAVNIYAGPVSAQHVALDVFCGGASIRGGFAAAAGNYVSVGPVIIPAGASYSAAPANGTAALLVWVEMRS